MKSLAIFCARWHLSINLIKTGVMIFNSEFMTLDTHPTFYLNNRVVAEVKDYDYVGVNFTSDRDKFKTHIDNVINKTKKAIFAARSNIREVIGNELRAVIQLKIFDSQIRPIMEYATPVWFCGKQINKLEKVHTS